MGGRGRGGNCAPGTESKGMSTMTHLAIGLGVCAVAVYATQK
jgi:hypothetical protein